VVDGGRVGSDFRGSVEAGVGSRLSLGILDFF